MISVSYPVMFHLYRRIDRNRGVRQIVEPGAGVQGRLTAFRSDNASCRNQEGEMTDFHACFLKALEKQEQGDS